MCATAAAAESQHLQSADAGFRIVAYVEAGSIPPGIHAGLTHVNYSFAHIDAGRALLDQPRVADDLAKLRAPTPVGQTPNAGNSVVYEMKIRK